MLNPADIVCLIPCAGTARRLRPLTLLRCKQLLPLCNRPLVDHILEAVSEAGIREAALIRGPGADDLETHVGSGERWGLHVEWFVQEQPKGIADAIRQAEAYVGGRPLLVYLGDNLFGGGIAPFVERFVRGHPEGLLRVRAVDDPRPFGVAVVEGDRVTTLVEKPPDPPSNLAITGLYGLPSSLFDAIRRTRPSRRGELEITDAIAELIRPGVCVRAETWDGFWEDAGDPGALLRANRALLGDIVPGAWGAVVTGSSVLDGLVQVGEGTRVEDTRIIGPATIGRGCRLMQSEVGPYASVGDAAVIEGSRVRESMVDCEAIVRDQTLGVERSILGRGARVLGEAHQPVRAVLGDGACLQAR